MTVWSKPTGEKPKPAKRSRAKVSSSRKCTLGPKASTTAGSMERLAAIHEQRGIVEHAQREPIAPKVQAVGGFQLGRLANPVAVAEEHALVVAGQLHLVPEADVAGQHGTPAADDEAVSSHASSPPGRIVWS